MENGHPSHAANELEVGEVVLIAQAGVGVDLESVVISEDHRENRVKYMTRSEGTISHRLILVLDYHFLTRNPLKLLLVEIPLTQGLLLLLYV